MEDLNFNALLSPSKTEGNQGARAKYNGQASFVHVHYMVRVPSNHTRHAEEICETKRVTPIPAISYSVDRQVKDLRDLAQSHATACVDIWPVCTEHYDDWGGD